MSDIEQEAVIATAGLQSRGRHGRGRQTLSLRHHIEIRLLQPLADRGAAFSVVLDAEMGLAQFIHEFVPHCRAALAEQLRANAELLAHRQIFESPRRHLRQNRQQLDPLLGETVDTLLLMAGIVCLGEDALLQQRLQPIGQDVRRDALIGLGQQFTEMPPVAEDDVADD